MVLGAEYELRLVTRSERARAVRSELMTQLVQCVPRVTAGLPNLESLPAIPVGFMLGNGSRVYRDGDFIEICSPEVIDPLEVVQWQRANEGILLAALPLAASAATVAPNELGLARASTDHQSHYCGIHVSYQTQSEQVAALVEHLTPFLVTRFYACAGGLGPCGLTMTHKNCAVKCVASADTRNERGIVCLRDEPLSGNGGHRIHLTHGDLCMSDLSVFLTVGCTALVVLMLEAGACIGPCFRLLDPIDALRRLDDDFTWSQPLPLACGSAASPLDIQEHYLKAAEGFTKRFELPWTVEVIRQWRRALDRLRAHGPGALCRSLDAYVKLALYRSLLTDNGLTISDYSRWCTVLDPAQGYLGEAMPKDVPGYLRDVMPAVTFGFIEEGMDREKLNWAEIPRIADLQRKLIAVDLTFHDISPDGLYHCLRRRRLVDPPLVTDDKVQHAIHEAPQNTRAAARSLAIRDGLLEGNAIANWLEVRTPTRRALFLDPAATDLNWIPAATGRPRR